MENRIKTTLKFLNDGQSFKIGDLRLGIENENILTVSGWSQYLDLSNLSKSICLEELAEIKRIGSDMIDSSNDLKSFRVNKSVKYILYYDDGGKTSIEICSEKDEVINWKLEL